MSSQNDHLAIGVSVKWNVQSTPNVAGWGHAAKQDFDVSVSLDNVEILKRNLSHFEIKGRAQGKVVADFGKPVSESDIVEWLQDLETALTVWSGLLTANDHYGTRYFTIDVTLPQFRWAESTLRPRAATYMTSTENLTTGQFNAQEIYLDSIRELFASGLRANTDEAKYLFWFIVIEEFLEKTVPLSAGFPLLFKQEEITKLNAIVGDSNQKKSVISALSSRTATPRHNKLFEIFSQLGITEFSVRGQTPRPVDPSLCRRIIEGRNALFHAGKSVDRMVLYGELLPILKQLVPISRKLVQMRESAAAEES